MFLFFFPLLLLLLCASRPLYTGYSAVPEGLTPAQFKVEVPSVAPVAVAPVVPTTIMPTVAASALSLPGSLANPLLPVPGVMPSIPMVHMPGSESVFLRG